MPRKKRPPTEKREEEDDRALHKAVSRQLEPVTRVPPEAPPQGRSRRGEVLPAWPPEDIVGMLAERVGLAKTEAVEIWQRATTYMPSPDTVDPYHRWWTHRAAALNLGQLLQRYIPVETLPLAEISGYAALLWPLILPRLRQRHPIARYLQGRAEEPSHLFWRLETAYIPICIAVYAADGGRWLVVLNAAVEEPAHPWRTLDSEATAELGMVPDVLQRLYVAAVDDVDIPAYAPPERQLTMCPRCHRWCGWDGVCRHCRPSEVLPLGDARWQGLEQGADSLDVPSGNDWEACLLGHSTTHTALLALKSLRGQVTLQEAMDLVLSLRPTLSLPRILRQAGFGFLEAQAILQRVRSGVALPLALPGSTGRR